MAAIGGALLRMRGECRCGKAAPWSICYSTKDAPPAARLGRAALRPSSEAATDVASQMARAPEARMPGLLRTKGAAFRPSAAIACAGRAPQCDQAAWLQVVPGSGR